VEWEVKRIEVKTSWVNAGGILLLLGVAIFAFARDVSHFLAGSVHQSPVIYGNKWLDALLTTYVCWVAFELTRMSEERTLKFGVSLWAIAFVVRFLLAATNLFGPYASPVRLGNVLINSVGFLFLIMFSVNWFRARTTRV
jgi:hypothetical protein